MLLSFFNSSILLHIKKNSVEKLSKHLEMEVKTYTRLDPFVFEKIKFNVLHSCLHYIQHDFIRQRPGMTTFRFL